MKDNDNLNQLARLVRRVLITTKNFPRDNFVYRGIAPLLLNNSVYRKCVDKISDFVLSTNANVIVSPELSGCLLATSVSYKINFPIVVARKPGKLPREVYSVKHKNEFSNETLQIHVDSLLPSDKVFILDDAISTGGTLFALQKLVENFSAQVVGAGFLFETVLMKKRT